MLRDGGYNLGTLRSATNPGRDRYRNVNNETGTKKTVELRQHQGTIDYEKTKHWKDLMLAMIERGASLNSIPGLTAEEVYTSPTVTNLTSSLNLRRRHERIYQFAQRCALTIKEWQMTVIAIASSMNAQISREW